MNALRISQVMTVFRYVTILMEDSSALVKKDIAMLAIDSKSCEGICNSFQICEAETCIH